MTGRSGGISSAISNFSHAQVASEPQKTPQPIKIPREEVVVVKEEPVKPDLIPTNVVEKVEEEVKPSAEEIYMNQQALLEQQEQLVEQLIKNEDPPEESADDQFILSPDEPGICALALFDYAAGADDEISFDPNDLITHIEMVSGSLNFTLFSLNFDFFSPLFLPISLNFLEKLTQNFETSRLTKDGGEDSIRKPILMAYSQPIMCK